LKPGAFEFVLDSELKRAVRVQIYLTLVLLEARREGMTAVDVGSLKHHARSHPLVSWRQA